MHRSGIRSLLVLGGALAILAGAVYAAYTMWSSARSTRLTERNLRAVAAIARQLGGRIDGLRTLNETLGRSKYIPRSVDKLPTTVVPEEEPEPEDLAVVWSARMPDSGDASSPSIDEPATVATVRLEEGHAWLYLSYEPLFDEAAFRNAPNQPLEPQDGHGTLPDPGNTARKDWCWTDGGGRRCVRLDLAALVSPLLGSDSGPASNFDGLLLTSGDGSLLHRTGIAMELDETTLAAARPRDDGAIPSDAKKIDRAEKDAPPEHAEPSRAAAAKAPSAVESMRFQEQKYLVFTSAVPVPLPAYKNNPEDRARNHLFIRAVVAEQKFDAEKRRIPQRYLVSLLLLILLGVCAWPSLKLALLGASERLSGIDVRLLAVLTVAAAGCVAAALLHARHIRLLERDVDGDLRRLARTMSDRLVAQMRAAGVTLENVVEAQKGGKHPREFEFDIEGIDEVVWLNMTGTPTFRVVPDSFAARSPGHAVAVPRVTAGDRQYFRDARARRYWFPEAAECPDQPEDSRQPFTAEVVRSRTTGGVRLVVAQPIERVADVLDSSPSLGFALVSLEPGPLVKPVLPVGFGVAVMDRDGHVQLHSEANRSLSENLFDETARARDLEAAIQSRQVRTLDADYAGRATSFHVRPICGTPWTVVAFSDHEVADRELADALTSWAPLFGSYFAALAMLLLAVQVIDDSYRAAWAWPDREGIGGLTYALLGGLLSLIAALLSHSFLTGGGWSRLNVLLAMPPLGVCVTYAILQAVRLRPASAPRIVEEEGGLWEIGWAIAAALGACILLWNSAPWTLLWLLLISGSMSGIILFVRYYRRSRYPLRTSEASFRAGYTTMLFGLLLLCGIVPATVLYRDAAAQAGLHSTRSAQLAFVERLIERATKLRSRFLGSSKPEIEALKGRLAVRNEATSDVYPLRTLQRAVVGSQETLSGQLLSAGYLSTGMGPAQRAMSSGVVPAGSNGRDRSEAGDRGWQWTPTEEGRERLRVRDGRLAALIGQPGSLEIDDYAPKGTQPAAPKRPGPVFWALAALGLGLAFAFVWGIARLLFVMDADSDDDGGVRGPAAGILGRWKFSRNGGEPKRVEKLDLAVLRRPETVREWLKQQAGKWDVEGVRIVGLETIAADIAAQRALIDGLRSLIDARGNLPIVLCSPVDPIRLSTSHAERDAEKAGETAQQEAAAKPQSAGTTPPVSPTEEPRDDWHAIARDWALLLRHFERAREDVPWPSESGSIGERLDASYWNIWHSCDVRERLALRQLAEEGFVAHRARSVVRQLLHRRLLHRTPALSLRSPEFARFVMRAASKQTVEDWESTGTDTSMPQRRLIALALVGVMAFLFLTQPELFSTTNALVTAMAGLLPILLRVFGVFGEESTVRRKS